jgi:hypothetical protein
MKEKIYIKSMRWDWRKEKKEKEREIHGNGDVISF